jgi:hypothetical protein
VHAPALVQRAGTLFVFAFPSRKTTLIQADDRDIGYRSRLPEKLANIRQVKMTR